MATVAPGGTRFAIPDFTATANTLLDGGEPSTWQFVASSAGQADLDLDGAYTTTASHMYFGDATENGSYRCFQRNGPGAYKRWQSRTASNFYLSSGAYAGSTTTVVDGSPVKGEFVTVTAPRGIVIASYGLVSEIHDGNCSPPSAWVLAGSNDGGGTYTAIDSRSGMSSSGDMGVFGVGGSTLSFTTFIFIVTANAVGGAATLTAWNIFEAVVEPIACFARGTRILTEVGYKAVETLDERADRVVTGDGRAMPFRMHATVVGQATPSTAPYRIAPNAFGRNVPKKAICMSPTHSFLRDNLVAEGAVVESFGNVDTVFGGRDPDDYDIEDLAKVYTWNDRLGGFTRALTLPSSASAARPRDHP